MVLFMEFQDPARKFFALLSIYSFSFAVVTAERMAGAAMYELVSYYYQLKFRKYYDLM